MSKRSTPNSKFQILNSSGFTLIELLVVLFIMGVLASILTVNLAGQRASRDIRIAENQLVTNIRQAQSATLSSKVLPNGQDPDYYLLKFDLTKPSQYKIQAIYNVSASPQLVDIETINLPQDIQIATITPGTYPITVDRSAAADIVNQHSSPNQYLQSPTCALVSFAAPFGGVIFNDGCVVSSPPSLQLSDDYYSKIINFQNNVGCTGYSPPAPSVCTAGTNSNMSIILTDTNKTVSKTVTINGITGAVSFN